jgi:microcystin-dependent protein
MAQGLVRKSLGQRGGTETNTLNQLQLPSHTHTASGTVNLGTASNAASGSGAFLPISTGANFYSTAAGAAQMNAGAVSVTVGNTGNNQPVNNIQPFQCVSFIIALQGTFPSRN